MKSCYINSVASISAQDTLEKTHFLNEIISHKSVTVNAFHPNYKTFIDVATSRRMATGVKMGVTTAIVALRKAQIKVPDAIITGTGMGCIEDSEKFLDNIINDDEQYLTPTLFIKSTHNTVGAQIALSLNCKGYNITYVHGAASFPLALFDAQLMLHENEAKTVLVGGVDELGKQFINEVIRLEEMNSKGITVPFGEGANFFLLSSKKQINTYAMLKNVNIFHVIELNNLQQKLEKFLNHNHLSISDVDVVVLGCNGDAYDNYYHLLQESAFERTPQIQYKHLSGEFFTSLAFGFWIASNLIKKQYIPDTLLLNSIKKSEYKNVLLYNQFKGHQHSFILLTSC